LNKQTIRAVIKTILIDDFLVPKTKFRWDIELEHLQEAFNILGIFLNLENALSNYFKIDIPLVEHINPSFHTPDDIADLLQKILAVK